MVRYRPEVSSDISAMQLLLFLVFFATPFMCVGFGATRGLSGWLRIAGTLTPPVLLVGTTITFFVLTICKEADTSTPSQVATCNVTSSLAVPVTVAYFVLVGLAWSGALRAKGDSTARKVSLGAAAIVALLPIALAVALWAYVQL